MRVPLNWLRDYVDPPLDTHAIADRLTMTGTKVEAVLRHGVDALENFVVGRVLEAEQHPNADRLSVCLVDIGDQAPSQIVCGAPNVAAGQTVAVAKPGAVMPDGSKLGKAKLRGVESNGMILAEDEVAIGTEHAGIMVLEPDGLHPGTPLQEVLPIATDVLELEITSNRPDCLGVYGVARETHAATGAPLAAPPWSEDPGTAGDVQNASDHGGVSRPVPALHRARVRVREDRTEPAVAQGAADGGRPAADLERRRHHQLRDAAHRTAAARVRPRPGGRRASHGAASARRRADRDARRSGPDARPRHGPDRGCRRPHFDRRNHGRSAQRGARRHDPRPDGGGQLERGEHPSHVAQARVAQRGVGPLREAASARAGDGGAGPGHGADARADRRPPAPRDDRRRR